MRAIAVTCVFALIALALSATTDAKIALHSPAGHVVLATASATIASLSAYLLFARAARDRRAADVLLICALVTIAAAALAFGAIPAAAGHPHSRFTTWSSAFAAIVAALNFELAAAAGDRRFRHIYRALGGASALSLGLVMIAALVVVALGDDLPRAISASISPDGADHPRIVGEPVLLAASLAAAALSIAAAAGLARRSSREQDELYAWLALASALFGLASIGFFLFPSKYSEWLFVGDYLTVALLVALLAGAAREITAYQRGIAGAASVEERRRLARELHDGLAQELAFISTQTRWVLAEGADQRRLEQLALAAERALDESRSAIRALTSQLDEPFEVAVAQAAEEVAERVGLGVSLELMDGIEVAANTRQALLRILREALNNTARHGQATEVTITLRSDKEMSMTIEDNGVGFEPDARRDGFRFGLTSMSERAQAVGGELRVDSSPGQGTRIQVVIP